MRRLLGILLLGLALPPVKACPICLGFYPQEPTLADEVIAARDVVLAQSGKEALDVAVVIKGDADLAGQPVRMPEAKGPGMFILTRLDDAAGWKLQGPSALYFATFLPKLAALPAGAPKSDAEGAGRLELMRPFLGHGDPRIARSAWSIWAGAPYRLVKGQAHQFDRKQLRKWIDDPSMAPQRSLWLVLLGLQGNGEDTTWLAAQSEAAWKAGDARQLAALLTALVAQRGTEGVDFIEERYIRDRGRTMDEVQGGLAALGLHGREGPPELRQRVIDAYRVFISERKPLAGFVARDLADWQRWEFAPIFQAMLASSDPVHPTARQGMTSYLSAMPAAQ